MKTQINFKVPKSIADKIRSDASRNHKTLDVVGTAIFKDFFASWSVIERAGFYAKAPNKIQGRKIAA